ncbi:type IVB secretion system protein IcmW [Pseudoxanthomonas kaohsiungensis]|uniref:Type IVB secretion system protein IcmW n=1 Tax=Pseudoxanthomonas kaohsiungensis TaxID=283923 RepID=A0ABW3LXB9_9GAMM|nr:type IVB secretion system protein IcmW [Pseudoxanthomonas kaohsiungensis]KAF1702986.1 hypothetical protein CSC66_09435 [Pseudoxanthomonas kaohsiungensis]
MLDLDANTVRQHWLEASPGLAELLDHIERTEDWTVDGSPAIGRRLVELGVALNRPGAARALEALDRDRLLFLLVYISSSKALRLLQWLDNAHAGMGTRLLTALLEDGARAVSQLQHEALVQTMIQRLRIIQNTPFLNSVFDPTTLGQLERVIRQHNEDVSHA